MSVDTGADVPLRVLQIEDDPQDARLVASMLSRGGGVCRLEHVSSLREASGFLSRTVVDVILLDLALPDSRGLDTLRSLRRYTPTMPVVVLTDLADEDAARLALQAGAQDYLHKGEIDGRLLYRAFLYAVERKRVEEEKRVLELHVQHQQKLESIGILAGGVAHEINNPLTGIINYAQLIVDQLEPGSPLAEYAAEIMHESERVSGIVRNLLTFARKETQRPAPTRISEIVEPTLSLVRAILRKDGIKLSVDVPDSLPLIGCRGQQIQQVLMNLITNARDALNEKYPQPCPDKAVSVAACLIEREGRTWIRTTVEDHGTGILPEVQDKMFTPFFTTKPKEIGTGLGMWISHGIIQKHGGELSVDTEPGKWTRVHIDLPVETSQKPALAMAV